MSCASGLITEGLTVDLVSGPSSCIGFPSMMFGTAFGHDETGQSAGYD